MRGVATFRYRVPSSPMPWPALQQPDHRQPSALDDAVLGQRLHRVLATGRREPTRRQPQRRDGVAVQLDDDRSPRVPLTNSLTASPRRPALGPRAPQGRPQFLFESRRDRVPAAGQRADHHPVGGIQFGDHRAGHMPQPTGHPVPLHRGTHRFRYDQTDPRSIAVAPNRAAMRARRGRAAPRAPLD